MTHIIIKVLNSDSIIVKIMLNNDINPTMMNDLIQFFKFVIFAAITKRESKVAMQNMVSSVSSE